MRWAIGVVGLLVLLGVVVWAAGGFRETAHSLPEAAVGDRIDLGRYAITVNDVYFTDKDENDKPLKNDDETPKTRLVVDVTMEMLDDKAGLPPQASSGGGVGRTVLIQNAVSPWDGLPNDAGGGPRDDLQPGVPVKVAYYFVPPPTVPKTVRITLGSQSYEWSNMINPGPDWSSIAVPAVVVTDVPVTDRSTT